jgi:uncharacterized damage-inducible protein DinB
MNPYLFPGLEFGPKVVEQLLSRIEPSRFDHPTHQGRFSPREVLAHLADWEPILLARMQATKESGGGTITGIDEGERAIEQNYAKTDPFEQARLFRSRREKTIAWLKTVGEEDWNLTAIHNERGPQTLYDQANMLLGHDLYHIAQLSDVLEGRAVGTW